MPPGIAAGISVILAYGGVFRPVALTACAALRGVRDQDPANSAVAAGESNARRPLPHQPRRQRTHQRSILSQREAFCGPWCPGWDRGQKRAGGLGYPLVDRQSRATERAGLSQICAV
jgi:hypothetical protein